MAENVRALTATAATAGLGGIASIAIAWRLGPIGRGQYGIVTGVAGTVGILFGMGLYWPVARMIGGGELSRRTLLRAAELTVASSLAGGVLCASWLASSSKAVAPTLAWVLVLIGAVIVAGLYTFTQQLILATYGVWAYARGASVPILAATITSLTEHRIQTVGGPPFAGVAWITAQLGVLIVSMRALSKLAVGQRSDSRVDLVRAGLSDHSGTMLQHVGFRLDLLLAPALLRPSALAGYMLVAGFVELAWLPSVAYAQVVWREELRGFRRSIRQLVAVGAAFAAIGTILTAGTVAAVTMWGPLREYPQLNRLFAILSLGVIASGAYRPLQSRWLGRGDSRILRRCAVATAATSVILYPISMREFGAAGGAGASSAVYIVQLSSALFLMRGGLRRLPRQTATKTVP